MDPLTTIQTDADLWAKLSENGKPDGPKIRKYASEQNISGTTVRFLLEKIADRMKCDPVVDKVEEKLPEDIQETFVNFDGNFDTVKDHQDTIKDHPDSIADAPDWSVAQMMLEDLYSK